MSHFRASQLFGVLTCMAASGCIPGTATEVPRISGRVVDVAGNPVGGAEISIVADRTADANLDFQLTSASDGRFHRNEKIHWIMFPLIAADVMAPAFTARVSHNNSQVGAKHFGGGLVRVRLF